MREEGKIDAHGAPPPPAELGSAGEVETAAL